MDENNMYIPCDMVWNISQVNSQLTEIYIYDNIANKQSTDFWTGKKGTEITPTQFNEDINKVVTPEICVRINSGGGSVFAAEAIRTAIREKRAKGKTVTCKIDGFCGSAAVGISAACEKTSIAASGYLMIHDPSVFVYGYCSEADFSKNAVMLNKIKKGLIAAYVDKTCKTDEELSALMTAETWYTGEEAVENGFCDELLFEEPDESDSQNALSNSSKAPENMSIFNASMSMYRNIPKSLLNSRRVNLNGGIFNEASPPGSGNQNPISQESQENQENQKGVENSMEIKTVEELRAAHPELTAQIAAEATAAERKRIQDIENVALAGFEEVINKAKFESPVAASEVALQIIAEQKKQGTSYLAKVSEDVADSGIGSVESGAYEGLSDESDPFSAAIDKVLPETK
ncbi:MAG: Clp protease ClpP [Oscillospiraceae bacterium]|nr:Clp protease ClpP [Oscillospiraceae bacterium]